MAVICSKTGNWNVQEADSMDSLVQFASRPRAWSGRKMSIDSCFSGTDIMTKTYSEAEKLATLGWAKGREKLSENLDAAKFVNVSSAHKSESLDVAGAYPIVPAYIAGAPDCMIQIGDAEKAVKPIYRFIVSMSVSCSVSGEVILRRGAAILSWVDKLEADGARCEILLLMSVEKNGNKLSISVMVKRADEALELDRVAFALTHPSMLRRILFACYEQDASLESKFSSHYGTPSDLIPEGLQTPHSLYFGKLHGSEPEWKSPESAVAAVEKAIQEVTQHGDLPEAED